jgi:hypothetical protein
MACHVSHQNSFASSVYPAVPETLCKLGCQCAGWAGRLEVRGYQTINLHFYHLQGVRFKTNPYVWSDTASEVTSPVVQVQLKVLGEQYVEKVAVEELSQPVRIDIPMKPLPLQPMEMKMTKSHQARIVFNKTSNASQAMIHLDARAGDLPAEAQVSLIIYHKDTINFNITEFMDDTKNATLIFNETIHLG